MKIVETDNFGGDYPNERFVGPLPHMNAEQAEKVAAVINEVAGERHHRYWKVVDDRYELQPGFEP